MTEATEISLPSIQGIREAAAKLPKDLKANALALCDDMEQVIEGLGDSDKIWYPTRLRIVQGTTKTKELTNPDEAARGRLIIGNTVVGKEMNVYAIRLWNSRTLMNPDVDKTNVMCTSPDGKFGTRYGRCGSEHCLYAKFDEASKKAVPCRSNQDAILLTDDFRHILHFQFYRTSSDLGKNFKAMLSKVGPEYMLRKLAFKTEDSEKKDTVSAPAISRTDVTAGGAEREFILAVTKYYADRRHYELARHEAYLAEKRARGQEAEPVSHEDVRRIAVAQEQAGVETGGIDL